MVAYSHGVASQAVSKPVGRLRSRSLTQPVPRQPANNTFSLVSRPNPVTAFVTSPRTHGSDEPIYKWSVQVAQDWEAVRNLIKVTYHNVSSISSILAIQVIVLMQ